MVKYCKIIGQREDVNKWVYKSLESGLEVAVIRVTPMSIFNTLYNAGVNITKYFTEAYYNKIKKSIKKDPQFILATCYTNALNIYFEWVVLKAIEGYTIKLFASSGYIVKVYPYTPTAVENKRLKDQRKRVPIEQQIHVQDFYNRSYRIGLFRINTDGYYENTNYFFRLSPKYKKLLEAQIKKDPDIYATNITI